MGVSSKRKETLRLFPYFGSKVKNARRYPAPKHPTIIEPFAGAAGYASLYAERDVILVERDPKIAAVLRYLVGATPDEIMALPLLNPEQTVHDFPLTNPQKWLIGLWCNPTSRPCTRLSSWGRRAYPNMPMNLWGEKSRARLSRSVLRIKHWQVIEGSYQASPFEHLATWFVDPPYEVAGKHYPTNAIDYTLLGDWCRNLRGQVIVCEAADAKWLPFTPLYEAPGSVIEKNTRRRSTEAVWITENP